MDFNNIEWQPIETAPKDGTKIIILENTGRVQVARWCVPASSYHQADWYVSLTGSSTDDWPTLTVTHWLPIPNLPHE